MSLESFLQDLKENQAPLEPHNECLQTGTPRKRFEVYTSSYRHAFTWSHILQIAMDRSATELTIELNPATITVTGVQLSPLYEACLTEAVEWIRPLPGGQPVAMEALGPLIQTITVESKTKLPPSRRYNDACQI